MNMKSLQAVVGVIMLVWLVSVVAAQQEQSDFRHSAFRVLAPVPLPDEPLVVDTAEQHKIRIVVVTKGFSHPWSLTFLPDGGMLVTERAGRLRIVRNGVLDPQPITGVPEVHIYANLFGLMDTALHPQFAENKLIYFTYLKPLGEGRFASALARGRFDGLSLANVRDIFETPGGGGSRIAFGPDGTLYMTIGDGRGNGAQDPNDLAGKVLRLRDDGSIPNDNPFVGRAGHRPEIYSLGHRSNVGLAVHPETGAAWTTEHGPQGGDEINVLLPGRNYGWPIVSYGRTYGGQRVSEIPWREGMEQPMMVWVPSIALSGMVFYTGDKFPSWKGNLFVGGMAGLQLQRVVFTDKGPIGRETLLAELKQRIRDVRQGPDGFLYLVTDANPGGILRIEPAGPATTISAR